MRGFFFSSGHATVSLIGKVVSFGLGEGLLVG